jgi:hypothetical protein
VIRDLYYPVAVAAEPGASTKRKERETRLAKLHIKEKMK